MKWTGAAVAVLLAVAWIGSRWWTAVWDSGSGVSIGLYPGVFRIGHWNDIAKSPLSPGWTLERNAFPRWSWQLSIAQHGPEWTVSIPLWIIALPCVIASAIAWRLDVIARNNSIVRGRYVVKWRSGNTSWTIAGLTPDRSFYGWYRVFVVDADGVISPGRSGGMEGCMSPADYDRVIACIDTIRQTPCKNQGADCLGVLGEGTMSKSEILFRLYSGVSTATSEQAFSNMCQILDDYVRRATALHEPPPA